VLHTVLDVQEAKVVDLVPSGDPTEYLQELVELYARVTGQPVEFTSLDQAKKACMAAIHTKFFGSPSGGRPTREYDTRPVTPPWINPETGKPTRDPPAEPPPRSYSTSNREPGPVGKAREVFVAMWGSPRKDIIEECARRGIKRSTASTQYQHFKKAKEQEQEYRNPETGMPQLAPGTQLGDAGRDK
jgi:hypothetical protein